jgi:hypothetical protein
MVNGSSRFLTALRAAGAAGYRNIESAAHMNLTFEVLPFRFHMTALERVVCGAGGLANVLRGALGVSLRQLVCDPGCPGTRECPARRECVYARLFEPGWVAEGPSGLRDWPRPFVLRAPIDNGHVIEAGQALAFELHLFDLRQPLIQYFALSFQAAAAQGLGQKRGRASLSGIDLLDSAGGAKMRLDVGAFMAGPHALPPVSVDFGAAQSRVDRVLVRFLTPTELKGDEQASAPDFRVLFARIRDRVSTLRGLYGEGALDIDFKEMGARAEQVRLARASLTKVTAERRSSRTGQTHPLGGFVGEVEFEGALGEFLPYLEAARWTGVGRQTVWGKGSIETFILGPRS